MKLIIFSCCLIWLCFTSTTYAKNLDGIEEHNEVVSPTRVRKSTGSNHYRNRRSIQEMNEEFDHPVYNITAFGREMIIVLEKDDDLISPQLTISYTSSSPNGSCNITNPNRLPVKNCFYKGYVVGEEDSAVSMSICDSLIGSISTKQYHYFIEPLTKGQPEGDHPVEHLIKRRDPSDGRKNPSAKCGTTGSSSGTPRYTEAEIHEQIARDQSRRQKRDYNAKEYYIEVMVVADQSMLTKYESDLEHYILTIMSGANRLFSHPSLGLVLSIVVTKIVVLDESTDLPLTRSASTLLDNFCTWQHRNHWTTDETDPDHYDLALLLTDIDICYYSNCDTLGMAQMGGMCTSGRSCTIVEDDGLYSSITVAHEIGHTFDMLHDDDPHCSAIEYTNNKDPHVMRPSITEVVPGQPWSICSKMDIHHFFEQGMGMCLGNKPMIREYQYPTELPGEFYSEDAQCEMLLGRGSKACEIPTLKICAQLWCERITMDGKKNCITRSVKRADGTPCGDNQKCFSGMCMSARDRPAPVNGGWASWSSYGECSRTCGGGIMTSERECSNPPPANGGRFCIGDKTRVASCNYQDCADDSIDFRAQQCANYNGQRPRTLMTSDNTRYPEWVPKYTDVNERDRCKLVCTDIHSSTYVTWEYKVIDGTKCSSKTTDICVQGQCRPAGCDHRLGSKTKYNKCGICGGSRKSCKKMKAKYNLRNEGYNDVITFPVGANRITVTQKTSGESRYDGNYLVLKDDQDDYLVNGDMYLVTTPKDIQYGGITIKYSGVGQRTETIKTESPLKKVLKLQVLTNRNSRSTIFSPRIKIQYYIPRKNTKRTKSKKSKKNRNSRLRVSKTDLTPRQAVPVPSTIAPIPEIDGEFPEGARWVMGRWRKCKVSGERECGKGQMKRVVSCKNGKTASSSCNNREKPRNRMACQVKCPRNKPTRRESPVVSNRVERGSWRFGHWSPCSTSCGLGFKKRQVKCLGSSNTEIADSLCNLDLRPSDTHGCRMSDCRS